MENDWVFYDIWEINGQDFSLFKSSFDQGRAESSSLVLYLTKGDGASSNGVNLSVKTKIINFMAPVPAPDVKHENCHTPGVQVKGGRERFRDPYHSKYSRQAASIVPTQCNDSKILRTTLVNYNKLHPAAVMWRSKQFSLVLDRATRLVILVLKRRLHLTFFVHRASVTNFRYTTVILRKKGITTTKIGITKASK